MRSLRRYASTLTSILGVILIIAGLLLAYTSQTLFDSDSFADRAASSLGNRDVAALAADRLTGAVVSQYRDLTPYRPLVLGASRAIVASDAFRGIVRRAARTVHHVIMSGEGREVLLTLSDIGVVIRSVLASQPELAGKIPEDTTALIASLDELPKGEFTLEVLRSAHGLSRWTRLFLISGLGFMFIGFMLSIKRMTALLQQGLALVFISIALYVLVHFGGRWAALSVDDPMVGKAIAGLWNVFSADFLQWVFALCGIGLIMVAGASSLLRRFRPFDLARIVWDRIKKEPGNAGGRLFRAMVLVCAGLLLILRPLEVLTTLAFLVGICLGFAGLREFFDIIARGAARSTAAAHPRGAAGQPSTVGRSASMEVVVVGIAAGVLVAAGVFFLNRAAETAAAPRAVDTCNGHRDLCRRPLNEVVFAGTHNSMGAADIPDWMFANQECGIVEQLDDGIRALMIDAHPAVPVGDRVKTVLEDETAARETYEEAIGREGVEAAMRIRDRLVGGTEGDPDVYLCHGFCELGALRMTGVLEDIREFLIMNPNEVLIVVIQDEGVLPEEIQACFEESRLIDFVYFGGVTPPWPTLEEMVSRDERVLVMAEHRSDGVPWLHGAFEIMQETPYRFRDPSEFSCEPNRGGTSGSLLLLNHWIETPPNPLPSNAEVVNAYDFLLARARRCEKERGRVPNIIAVDFYRTGGLMEVVATLNGIASK